jgi:transcription termination factor Rho
MTLSLKSDIDLPLQLIQLSKDELVQMAKNLGIKYASRYRKDELVNFIVEADAKVNGFEKVEGYLDIIESYGFLRENYYEHSPNDVYASMQIIKKYNLRQGDKVEGWARPPKSGEKYRNLQRVIRINDKPLSETLNRPIFEKLVPIFPDEKFNLETTPYELSTRIIDLFIPIGKGQRGLIVAPPRTGKTTLLKRIAQAINVNHPEVYVIALLVDERPEEVTDMSRSIRAEIVASTFDEPPEKHIRVTELVLEKAKRMVEEGKDVLIIMDSLTRLTRACNLVLPPTGRTLSGGLDTSAIYRPKRFFGAARNIEGGGSLTIIATVLVETGSKMDEVIFEEFKGTGNMEIYLSRKLAERRIFPAIDLKRSGTRHEELLLPKEYLEGVWILRRALDKYEPENMTEKVIELMRKQKTNKELIEFIYKHIKNAY